MSNDKIIAVIPARLNSSRFPLKLLKTVQEKSLLQHTYENACKIDVFDEIYIATDSLEIGSHAKSFSAEVIMTGHCENGTDRIIEAIMNTPKLNEAKIIVNMQGDHPIVDKQTIEKILEKLTSDNQSVMSTGVVPISKQEALSPHVVKCVFDQFGNALYFSRSLIPHQKNDDGIYYQHIGVYAYTRDFLLELKNLRETPLQKAEDLEQLKILELNRGIKVAVCSDIPLGVDTPEDLKKFEGILCQG